MKKIILIIVAVLIGVSASAQRIGIVAGVTGPNSALKDSQIGTFDQYHLGLVSSLPVMPGIRIQPELIYKVKGTTVDQIGSGNEEFDMKVGFLEFGLEAQAGIGGSLMRVYGLAEPFIGYNIRDTDFKGDKVVDNLSWAKTECGLAVGAGVELLSLVQASVKYFWNMGAANVRDESNKIYDGDSVRNFNGMTLSVALLF